ncbi:MAG: Uma2 family endonuclease [Thermomicrobiales bacterium]
MVATKRITVEEFETMSLEGPWELIDGELVEMSPSAEELSNISANIIVLVGQHVRARRLGRVYNAEGGFVLFPDRETVRAPDVAFVRADRVPHGEARKHFSRLAPDLAVEVLSPSDRPSEVVAKIEMYQEAGVLLIWLVDPDAKTVTVIAAGKATRVLQTDDTLDGGDILPGFSVPVAEIFA